MFFVWCTRAISARHLSIQGIVLVLAYYHYIKKTVVEIDTSNWALGGVLYQASKDSKLKLVAFFSAKHSAPKYNYKIYNKKLLVIIKALEE